jgi:SAM-dependent methyltransferase
MHSLRWIATLGDHKGMTKFTAITADKTMQQNCQREADALGMSHLGKIIIGNWFGNAPLEMKEKFDVILADYLIGAMDGFSPYQQDLMIPKLCKYLKPGGRLYLVGLQPIPDSAPGPADIICKVRQIRDACILLAKHRCYREYPVDWIERQIEKIPELKLVNTASFPILYKHQTIVNQINVARSKFPFFPSQAPGLVDEMKKVLDDLERQSFEATKNGQRIRLGFDYVVTAELME